MTKITAKLNHLRIAPRKVRLVANAIKGLSVNEAEAQLLFRPKHSSRPLLDLLRSAVANAQNNHKLNPDKLVVEEIRVDQGPTLKRFLPRAMGRATPIHKKTSHVSLVLTESKKGALPRFHIAITKKGRITKKSEQKKPKLTLEKERIQPVKTQEKVGIFKRIFRRKSV